MTKIIDLEERVFIVGGAGGGGIGTAICTVIAEAGGFVVGVDIAKEGRDAAARALAPFGTRHRIVDADLTDATAVETLVAAVGRDLGDVRGAVNVVGGMLPTHWGPLLKDRTGEAFDDVMRFNLRPSVVTAAAVARAVAGHGKGGSIVNIASAAGVVAMAYGGGYGAAKAALINLTRTMAVEWGPSQLRVNAVAPGAIRPRKQGRPRLGSEETEETKVQLRNVVPLGRRGEPEDVAGAVLFLLSDLAAYVTGHTLLVDGGSTARAPYTDGENLPAFVVDPAARRRLKGEEP